MSGAQVRQRPCAPFQHLSQTWLVQRAHRWKWLCALVIARSKAASRELPQVAPARPSAALVMVPPLPPSMLQAALTPFPTQPAARPVVNRSNGDRQASWHREQWNSNWNPAPVPYCSHRSR